MSQGGRSPWVEAGSARFAFKETGYEFTFDPPAAGSKFVLRGVVDFEWRERVRSKKTGKVVTVVRKDKRKYTAAGHRTRGSDPEDFTAARCEIIP